MIYDHLWVVLWAGSGWFKPSFADTQVALFPIQSHAAEERQFQAP